MTVMTTVQQRGEPMTYADLEALREQVPDDGRRYEIIDGTLIVSASPRWPHQRAVANMHLVLHDACPPELEVLFAPFDVELADDTVMQPDLIVARRSDYAEKNLAAVPVLAVEVLSPSTRLVDLNLKKARMEKASCPSYWVVDPGFSSEPSVTAWELLDGRYAEVAHAVGAEPAVLHRPFEVTVVPAELIR